MGPTWISILNMVLIFNQSMGNVCNDECYCNAKTGVYACKKMNLTEIPDEIYGNGIETLDLSENMFDSIPRELSEFEYLKTLNFSHNRVTELTDVSLDSLEILEILDLSSNQFLHWQDISSESLLGATSLRVLNLSNNPLGAMPFQMQPIRSASLEILTLSNCSIIFITKNFLQKMTKLKTLHLSNNQAFTVGSSHFTSISLKYLDISDCNLQKVNNDFAVHLPKLQHLKLSNNPLLRQFSVYSNLTKLDLSHCNLNRINTSRIPRLTKAHLRGNHIRSIMANDFPNPELEMLDLSDNAISYVDMHAFKSLTNLSQLDLSINTISTLSPNTFVYNKKLLQLNLSRNYLTQVERLKSSSLWYVDMSFCEIHTIKADSLQDMHSVRTLILQRNLIAQIPDKLRSSSLLKLDLSYNRVSTITAETFQAMPLLKHLYLASNRLTSEIDPDFFYKVEEIRLDDNLWHCNCDSKTFRALYLWLFGGVQDPANLRCHSPANATGKQWAVACNHVWSGYFLTNYSANIYLVVIGGVLLLLCIVFYGAKSYFSKKRKRQEREQEQEAAELRERNRNYQRHLARHMSEGTAASNAPDPHELQRPPSYAEAIRMPPYNSSYASLAASNHSLSVASPPNISGSSVDENRQGARKKSRSKNQRRQSTSDMHSSDDADDGIRVQLNAARSEAAAASSASSSTTNEPPESQRIVSNGHPVTESNL